jgi:hypothetical protein
MDAGPPSDFWDTDWGYRKQLLFLNAGRTEDLQDFPVLVVLDPTNFNYANAKADGSDLVFIDDDNFWQLDHEIELWNPGGTSVIWVRVRQIDGGSNNDFMWLYYGNPAANDSQDPEGVWDNDYEGVYHFEGGTADSTNNNRDLAGTSNPTTSYVNLGNGRVFDGTTDALTAADTGLPEGNNERTISAWVNVFAINNHAHLFGYGNYGANHQSFSVLVDSNNRTVINVGGGHGPDSFALANATVDVNTWTWVAVTNNGDNVTVTINGNAGVTGSVGHGISTVTGQEGFVLGTDGFPTYQLEGAMDELRISQIARSADWLNAEYASMQNTLVDYRPEEAQ